MKTQKATKSHEKHGKDTKKSMNRHGKDRKKFRLGVWKFRCLVKI